MSKTVNKILEEVIGQLAKPFSFEESEIKKRSVFVTEEVFNQLGSSVKIISSFAITKRDIILIAYLESTPFLLSIGDYASFSLPSCEEWKDEVALYLFAISQLKILPRNDNDENYLRERIFTEEECDTRIPWDVISGFFPDFNIFKINETIPSSNDEIDYYLRSIVVSILCQNAKILNLQFDETTLDLYVDALNKSSYIPVDNFIHSLLSNEWKFCFLDLYRCLERLFRISWVHNFREPLGALPSIVNIDEAMDRTGVTCHENKCIEYMFSLLPPLSQEINNVIGTTSIDKYIYDLRNEIVHFQKSDNKIYCIPDATWNIVLQFMLSSLKELYNRFEPYIIALPEK